MCIVLHIVYSLHILHILHILCVTHTGISRLTSKYLHLVPVEQGQSNTQLNCCRHQRDSTNCSHQRRHQRAFRDILNISCIFCIFCIYCVMCTCTGRIQPSRHSVLLLANNGYQHYEKTHARCRVPQDSSLQSCVWK